MPLEKSITRVLQLERKSSHLVTILRHALRGIYLKHGGCVSIGITSAHLSHVKRSANYHSVNQWMVELQPPCIPDPVMNTGIR